MNSLLGHYLAKLVRTRQWLGPPVVRHWSAWLLAGSHLPPASWSCSECRCFSSMAVETQLPACRQQSSNNQLLRMSFAEQQKSRVILQLLLFLKWSSCLESLQVAPRMRPTFWPECQDESKVFRPKLWHRGQARPQFWFPGRCHMSKSIYGWVSAHRTLLVSREHPLNG